MPIWLTILIALVTLWIGFRLNYNTDSHKALMERKRIIDNVLEEIDPALEEIMKFKQQYGNPSTNYAYGNVSTPKLIFLSHDVFFNSQEKFEITSSKFHEKIKYFKEQIQYYRESHLISIGSHISGQKSQAVSYAADSVLNDWKTFILEAKKNNYNFSFKIKSKKA